MLWYGGEGGRKRGQTYLFRQMINADDDASASLFSFGSPVPALLFFFPAVFGGFDMTSEWANGGRR